MRWITRDFSSSADLGKNLSTQCHCFTLRKCSLKMTFMQLLSDVANTVNTYNYSCTGHKLNFSHNFVVEKKARKC